MKRGKCFADKEKKCGVLLVRDCENCSFHKTKKQYASDRLKHIDKEREFAKNCGTYDGNKFEERVARLKRESEGEKVCM